MNNNQRVQYIDVWRFFAIGLVIVSHIVEYSHPLYKLAWPGLIWRVHPLGQLGVHIFFCISGYVICRGMSKEVVTEGSLSLKKFYIRRAFRILPPFALYALSVSIASCWGIVEMRPAQLFQAATFLCNVKYIGECGWFFGHTWSLAFEEQFYVLFPFVFLLLALTRKRFRLVLIVFLLVAIILAAQLLLHPELANYLSIFSYMLAGCTYALFEDVLGPYLYRMPVVLWIAGIILLLGVHLVALPATLMNIVYPMVAPWIICALVFSTPLSNPVINKIFVDARLVYLGQISYTIYLWQQAATMDYGFVSPLAVFVLLACVFYFAHVSYQYFEVPLIRVARILSKRKPEDNMRRQKEPGWMVQDPFDQIDPLISSNRRSDL